MFRHMSDSLRHLRGHDPPAPTYSSHGQPEEARSKTDDPRFEPLERTITEDLKALWLLHVTEEEKLFVPHSEEEGERALELSLTAFVDDCTMEVKQTGERFTGLDGAREFYTQAFIPSFEGMQWTPQALVIGPQGVLDVADMTATLARPFAGLTSVGERVALEWVIYFPWDTDQRQVPRGDGLLHPLDRGLA